MGNVKSNIGLIKKKKNEIFVNQADITYYIENNITVFSSYRYQNFLHLLRNCKLYEIFAFQSRDRVTILVTITKLPWSLPYEHHKIKLNIYSGTDPC